MESPNKKVLVFGSGHLASRIKTLKEQNGNTVTIINPDSLGHKNEGIFRTSEALLDTINLKEIDFVYIVDDADDINLEFLLAIHSDYSNSNIAISIFNKRMGDHIKKLHPDLFVFNPGEISSNIFVTAIEEKVNHKISYTPPVIEEINLKSFSSSLFYKIASVFLLILLISTSFFHLHTGFSWVDSFYFVVVTMATVGYGDINLLNADLLSKIVGTLFIVVSMVFVGFSISLIMNEILKKREASLLGIRKYKFKDHVIVCGLGRIGYFVVDKLLDNGYKVIIVEKDNESSFINYFKSKGAKFYIGDASLPKTLQDVNVGEAKSLLSLVNDDSRNLEIGLNSRSINPGLKLILRIYDKNISEEIKNLFDIQLTFSVSEIVAQYLMEKTK